MDQTDTLIVVVDDEEYICNIIEESLASENYNIVTFSDPHEALKYIENNRVDLVLTDLMLGSYSGVEILESTLQRHRDAIVIIMTAHPTVQTAITVLKKGGYDFLVKPFKLEVLRATIKRSLAHQQLLRENLQLKSQVEFLKAAHTYGVGSDIEEYLRLVLNSCRTEFSAVAAGLLEADSAGGNVVRSLWEGDDERYRAEVLDESYLCRFTYTRSSQPHIKHEEAVVDGQKLSKMFISKPIFVRRTLRGVINLLIVDRFPRVTPGQLDVLSILTNSAAMALTNYRLYVNLKSSYLEVITSLAHAIEARDQCTMGHTDRVVALARLVAEELGWGEKQMTGLVMGCTLHDIGKLGVPDRILNKPERLNDEERRIMESHAEVGLKIISGIELLKPAVPYVASHHERYDGKGYPQGLKGEDIPIEGRLLAVVDTFDAILSDRPYRKGANLRRALEELWQNSGTQFDPQIVELFFKAVRSGKVDFGELYGREEDPGIIDEITATETVRV